MSRFFWGVDGFGRRHIGSPDFMGGRYVLFSCLSSEYFHDCIDLLEAQYK